MNSHSDGERSDRKDLDACLNLRAAAGAATAADRLNRGVAAPPPPSPVNPQPRPAPSTTDTARRPRSAVPAPPEIVTLSLLHSNTFAALQQQSARVTSVVTREPPSRTSQAMHLMITAISHCDHNQVAAGIGSRAPPPCGPGRYRICSPRVKMEKSGKVFIQPLGPAYAARGHALSRCVEFQGAVSKHERKKSCHVRTARSSAARDLVFDALDYQDWMTIDLLRLLNLHAWGAVVTDRVTVFQNGSAGDHVGAHIHYSVIQGSGILPCGRVFDLGKTEEPQTLRPYLRPGGRVLLRYAPKRADDNLGGNRSAAVICAKSAAAWNRTLPDHPTALAASCRAMIDATRNTVAVSFLHVSKSSAAAPRDVTIAWLFQPADCGLPVRPGDALREIINQVFGWVRKRFIEQRYQPPFSAKGLGLGHRLRQIMRQAKLTPHHMTQVGDWRIGGAEAHIGDRHGQLRHG